MIQGCLTAPLFHLYKIDNKTKTVLFSYHNMIRLLPTTDSQTISIIPRIPREGQAIGWDTEEVWNLAEQTWNQEFGIVNLRITEDGTGISEDILTAEFVKNGNYYDVTFASTILKNKSTYYVEIFNGNSNWYRDVGIVKDLINKNTDYSLNRDLYKEYGTNDEQEYIVI